MLPHTGSGYEPSVTRKPNGCTLVALCPCLHVAGVGVFLLPRLPWRTQVSSVVAIIRCTLPPRRQVYPVNASNLNYAPVALGFTLLLALGWWFANARAWYKGPKNGWAMTGDTAMGAVALDDKDAEVIVC